MRKILFRGKSPVVNDWVYGYYVKTQVDKKEVHTIIPFEELTKTLTEKRWFEVAPSTVGQFTGLTDKNGKRIFEGDIVKNDYGYIGQIVFKACSYYIEWKSGNFTIDLYVMANSLEVIGNIHDNPELLEGKE